MRTAITTIGVAVMLVLAGCTGYGTGGSGAVPGEETGATASGEAEEATERPTRTATATDGNDSTRRCQRDRHTPAPITPIDEGTPERTPTEPATGTPVAATEVAMEADGAGDGGGGGGSSGASSRSVGASVGGAQDANTFRTNVEEGYVPRPSSLTYEGLYHDYYFDTGETDCDGRFCADASTAVSRDPVSNETEYFMTVDLGSNLSAADFEHEPMDVVVVLDTSGSMSSPFDEYYYDEDGERRGDHRPKMEIATDAVANMTDQLEEGDRLGVVTYDNRARRFQPLRSASDLDGFDRRLQQVYADGGTNLDAGMREATAMLEGRENESREARIIYVTDAMPNIGDTNDDSLQRRIDAQADEEVYTTFVGVGVDFNTDLTESIATVRGANYYSVDSARSFEERMTDGFDYMVTPLAFNLSVGLDGEGYAVQSVYGTPNEADEEELLHANTIFPSRSTGNASEGSVVLVELACVDPSADVTLTTSYETPDGEVRERQRTVDFADREAPYFENSGIRKAVVLTEYATLLRNWMASERTQARTGDDPPVGPEESVERRSLGRWEQRSVRLAVSPPYDRRIARFERYFVEQAMEMEGNFSADLAVIDRLSDEARETGGDRTTDGAEGPPTETPPTETPTPMP